MPEQEHKEEQIIWESFRAGNEDAFARLFLLFGDSLFYYGCSFTNDRELIKDSIQELLCSLWERRNQCPEVAKVKYFLFSGLRRIILREVQRQRRYVLTSGDVDEQIKDRVAQKIPSREEDLIQQEINTQYRFQIKQAIEALSPRQREAIHLKYYEGLSYEEMAEVMQVQKGSIGHFIGQAIKALQKRMNLKDLSFLLPLIYFLHP